MAFLWLTRFPPYPPLRGGAYDYSRDMLHSLADVGPVHGLAYDCPEVRIPETSPVEWTTLPLPNRPRAASVASRLPNVAYRHFDRAYLDQALDMSPRAEAVYVDFIAMAWLVVPLRARLAQVAAPPPVIMITHNHEYAVRRQMIKAARSPLLSAAVALDAWKAGRLERTANAAADGLTAITKCDQATFGSEVNTTCIVVPPAYGGPVTAQRRIDADTPEVITLLGNRNAQHKTMVLARTLKALAARQLDKAARIEVAGAGDLTSFAQRYPGFKYIGYVEDLQRYLSGVRLALLTDDIGGGFKLRAMAYSFLRVPMLALDAAMAGMDFEEGVHFVGAGTLEELADKARMLIRDLPRLNALQEAAFEYAATRFDPAVPGKLLSGFAATLRRQRPESAA